MMQHVFHTSIPAVLFAAALLSWHPAAAPDNTKHTALIGFAGGLGAKTQTNLSFSARDGAQLAVDDANRRNIQIAGKSVTFKLMVVDDQSDVNFARITANSFVSMGVIGVIGHNSTDTSVATAKIYSDAGIAEITPTSTGRTFTQGGYKNVFQLLGHSDITATHLGDIAMDILKSKRFAVIDNGSVLGTGLADGFTQRLQRNGGTVVIRESVNNKTSDFNDAMGRVKATNPDAIFFSGVGPQAAAFTQSFQRMGAFAQLLLTGGGVNLEFPKAGNYPEGTYVLLHGTPVESRPGYAEFEKRFKQKFDTAISAYAMFSYDAVGMLIDALKRANSLNPKAAIDELHVMRYTGISGPVSFAADGSQNNPPYTLYRISQGMWRPVKLLNN